MTQGFTEADYTASKLEVFNADIYNHAGASAAPIGFNAGGNLKNQCLILNNCRVIAKNETGGAHSSAIHCGGTIASDGELRLYNTLLVITEGAVPAHSIHVAAGCTLRVYYFHSNMANVTTGGAGTLTNVLSTTLTVNAAIDATF